MHGVILQCTFDDARSNFYRSFHAVYDKIGQAASLVSLFHLFKSKCIQVLLYGTEAANLTAGQKHSLDFAITRIMMKVAKTSDKSII